MKVYRVYQRVFIGGESGISCYRATEDIVDGMDDVLEKHEEGESDTPFLYLRAPIKEEISKYYV